MAETATVARTLRPSTSLRKPWLIRTEITGPETTRHPPTVSILEMIMGPCSDDERVLTELD
jgi:hypothetical protein